jgi:hypothetical protein
MDKNTITVVSGLPRSGTSMMMKMLEAGGLEMQIDALREADEDNPKGYYEDQRVTKLKEDNSWVGEAKGKVVKVICNLLPSLPPEFRYNIVFVRREIAEVLASQKKMLERRGTKDSIPDDKMAAFFRKDIERVEAWLAKQPNIDVLYLHYSDVMKDPAANAERINGFLGGGLDVNKMAEVADPKLYRNRASS